MEDEAGPKAKPPWYKRATPVIATVGTLLAVAGSAIGLWDRFFPAGQKDVATIEMIEEGRPLALRDFMTETLGDYLTLVPDSEGAAPHQVRINGAAGASRAVVPSLPPTPAVPGISPFPEPAPGGPTGSSDTGSGGPSESTTESTEPESPSTSPPGAVTDETLENTARDVGESLFNDPGYFGPSDMRIFIQATSAQDTPSEDPAAQMSFENAVAQTSAEAAPQIVEALSMVEGTYDANPEPRGWVIPVNLSFEKLSGDRLSLTWSLEGIDVPQSWSGDKLAYRVQAKTDRASTQAEIWFPDLTVPGTYKLSVKLVKETDGQLVAEDSSGLVNQ